MIAELLLAAVLGLVRHDRDPHEQRPHLGDVAAFTQTEQGLPATRAVAVEATVKENNDGDL